MLAVWNHGKRLTKAREHIFPKMDFKPFDGKKFTKGFDNTQKKVIFGKSWYIDMLRRKSDEELNSLWYSLLKEKLAIQSDRYYLAQKNLGTRHDIKENKGKIAVSMARIKTVFAERQQINNEFTMLLEYWYIRNKQTSKNFEVDNKHIRAKMKPQLYTRKLVDVPRTKKLILQEMKKIENEKNIQLENIKNSVIQEKKNELRKLREEYRDAFYASKFNEKELKEIKEIRSNRKIEIDNSNRLTSLQRRKKIIFDNKLQNLEDKLNAYKASIEKSKIYENKEDEILFKKDLENTKNKLRLLKMRREKELDQYEEIEKFKEIKKKIKQREQEMMNKEEKLNSKLDKENKLDSNKNNMDMEKMKDLKQSKSENINNIDLNKNENNSNSSNPNSISNSLSVKITKNSNSSLSNIRIKNNLKAETEFKNQEYEITEQKKRKRADQNFENEKLEDDEKNEIDNNYQRKNQDYFNEIIDAEYIRKKTKNEKYIEFKEKLDKKTKKEVRELVNRKMIRTKEMLGGKYRKILYDYKHEAIKEIKPYQIQLKNEIENIYNINNLIEDKTIQKPVIIKEVKVNPNKKLYKDIFSGKQISPIPFKPKNKNNKPNSPLNRKEISSAKNLIARKNRKQILSYYIKNYKELSKNGQNKVYNKLQKIRSQEARNIIKKELIAIKASVSHPESFYRTSGKYVKKVEEKITTISHENN
jgi:hypothetical protein